MFPYRSWRIRGSKCDRTLQQPLTFSSFRFSYCVLLATFLLCDRAHLIRRKKIEQTRPLSETRSRNMSVAVVHALAARISACGYFRHDAVHGQTVSP